LSIVVMFPRQSGKNELQAQLEAYFLVLFNRAGGNMVKVSPTWKPQSINAMQRLERVLKRNRVTARHWSKESGYIYRLGAARMIFLSGAPESHIVGATADLLLEVDEAQSVRADKFDRDIAPMAASTNATRVFGARPGRPIPCWRASCARRGALNWPTACGAALSSRPSRWAVIVPPTGALWRRRWRGWGGRTDGENAVLQRRVDAECGMFPPQRVA
jgi:hypothetical protein